MPDHSTAARKVSAQDAARIGEEALAIVADVTGVRAVVVATEDGFDVAIAGDGSVDRDRIAALASSIAAVGQVVSAEAGLGRARCVTVDTDEGFATIYSVHRGAQPGLVINVIAGPDALLGQVHYRAAQAARKLASE